MKKLLVVSLALNAVIALMLGFLLWQFHSLSKDADDAFGKVDEVTEEIRKAARYLKSQGANQLDGPDAGFLSRESVPEDR